MEYILLALLIVLIALVVVLLTGKKETAGVEEKVNTYLKENFLTFQASLNQMMSATQTEVSRSKDLISDHLVKSLDNMKQMAGTIQKLVQQQEDAQKLGQSLKDLLQTPKLRGNYGETILEEMVERVLPKGIWQTQYQIDGREMVDLVIRFKDVIIPVDAKFPRDDYRRYIEAKDQAEKELLWKRYEEAVKRQIVSIEAKYIKPDQGTTNFALMFIPSEAVYYETIAENNFLGMPSRLYAVAQEHNVIPVSPNTFYAFLQVLLLGIKNIDIIKEAKKLQEGLDALERNFELFYKQYEDVGREIAKASESFRKGDAHIKRFKNNLEATLKLEGLEQIEGKKDGGVE
jgi:DNA recombination protein RmuC